MQCLWAIPVVLALAGLAAPSRAAPPSATDPLRTVQLPLRQLTGGPLTLRGSNAEARLHLGVRLDELVTRGRLSLAITPSPALLARVSHLQVRLNDTLLAVVPLHVEKAGERIVQAIELDPRLFLDDNWLSLRMIGHYTLDCEDATHNSLWAEVDVEASGFDLSLRSLALDDELALFPAPWFDRRGRGTVEIPVVLGAQASQERLAAASIMASWLGALAGERGARFPLQRNRLPAQHAIVLATPDQPAPPGLQLPEAQGPTVRLVRHPQLPHIKLLVLQGRNDAELRTAAMGLILGRQGLSGPTALIQEMAPIPPRPAYDAPNWVATDRPVRLGELVSDRGALQLHGLHADSVRVRWRTPPDLWQGPGRDARLELRYRTAQPSPTELPLLSVALNESFVRAWRLSNGSAGDTMSGLRRWLGGSDDASGSVKLALPEFQPRYSNTLDVRLPLGAKPQTGNCAGTGEATRASVDAESTLDFTALPHFLEMPNLEAFAGAGFPFTRYADLSQTAVVLPSEPDDHEIEALLNLMGSFGRWTGVAAWHFALSTPEHVDSVRDRDLLLIGGPRLHPLLGQWQQAPLLALQTHERSTRGPATPVPPWRSWLQQQTAWAFPTQAPVRLEAQGPLAVLTGFESPLKAGRSVVAFSAEQSNSLDWLTAALTDPGQADRLRGGLAVVRDRDVQSYERTQTYHTGHLPWTAHLSLLLSRHPWLTGAALALALGMLVWAVRLRLRWHAARRLKASKPSAKA